jgi:Tfp pilus assembly protein PilX
MKSSRYYQSGAVSLFIVVFTALLLTVVTVGFIRLMVQTQQQASAIDLSKSAYDSAQAGVEDAKRAILQYESVCASGDVSGCTDAKKNLDSPDCNIALTNVVTSQNGEVKVQQSSGDVTTFDQAYTCVKVILDTPNYQASLNQDTSKLIPLVGLSDFDSIKIDWFSARDLQDTTKNVNVPTVAQGTSLLSQSSWISSTTPNQPSIMRAQLMQVGDNGFKLSDFDGATNAQGISNANTLFLYPSAIVSSPLTFASNVRKSPSAPTAVHCSTTLNSGGYACSATITLPSPIGGGARIAYLNLTSLYRSSSYQVTLLSGGSTVDFDGVQPEVDSTGRSNDLFRRVQSRVEAVSGIYPQAAVQVSGNLCKSFSVTDNAADYTDTCTP